MKLKTKLTFGIGFLFLIIFVLVIFSSYFVQKLSQESDSILKDNYDSIVYSKNMISTLDDMKASLEKRTFNPNGNKELADNNLRQFETGRIEFETNLKAENGNITEIHEQDYVNTLNTEYNLYLNLCAQMNKGLGNSSMYFNEFLPLYQKMRNSIYNIYDVNIQAVERKNKDTKRSSGGMIKIMAFIGTICIVLAFVYFWYFSVYTSAAFTYLTDKMKGLLKTAGVSLDTNTKDESLIILHSINLLNNKLSDKSKKAE